jgi:hypothetical protein
MIAITRVEWLLEFATNTCQLSTRVYLQLTQRANGVKKIKNQFCWYITLVLKKLEFFSKTTFLITNSLLVVIFFSKKKKPRNQPFSSFF